MSRLLAFDTSTETVAIALVDGARAWSRDLAGGPKSSMSLLPAVRELLGEAGLEGRQLDAIGFGRGPGAFTGLRTACSVAQGLAFGFGCPVIAVDTLQLVAEDSWSRHAYDEVWTAMDARMDEIYAARWRRDPTGLWHELVAPALYTREAFAARLADAGPTVAVAGSALPAQQDHLHPLPGQATDHDAMPRGAALVGWLRQAGSVAPRLDAAQALPLYLRDKVALTTEERLARKAAS